MMDRQIARIKQLLEKIIKREVGENCPISLPIPSGARESEFLELRNHQLDQAVEHAQEILDIIDELEDTSEGL